MVTPQVQTASSSRLSLSDQSSRTAYERLLAAGLGAALAVVAGLALLVPGVSGPSADAATPTAAHGKATPRAASEAPSVDGATSVE